VEETPEQVAAWKVSLFNQELTLVRYPARHTWRDILLAFMERYLLRGSRRESSFVTLPNA